MWLEFLEGFDWCGSNDELRDRYTAGSWDLTVPGNGRNGTGATDPDGSYKVFSQNGQTEFMMGFAYKPAALTNFSIIEFRNNTIKQIGLQMTVEGRIKFYVGSSSIDESSLTLSSGDWHFIVVQVKIDSVAGLYNVWVDGVLWMDATGVDTQSAVGGIGNVYWPIVVALAFWDDIHLYLGAGASTAAKVGDSKVPAFLVNAAGDDAQWTPSAGANYENVDDPTADEDATYNEDGVAGQRDLYNCADLAAFTGSIKGVEVMARLRKTDVGEKQAKIACKSGATVYYGSDVAIQDTYAWFSKIWELDPDTAAEWTRINFNAAQFGAEVVS